MLRRAPGGGAVSREDARADGQRFARGGARVRRRHGGGARRRWRRGFRGRAAGLRARAPAERHGAARAGWARARPLGAGLGDERGGDARGGGPRRAAARDRRARFEDGGVFECGRRRTQAGTRGVALRDRSRGEPDCFRLRSRRAHARGGGVREAAPRRAPSRRRGQRAPAHAYAGEEDRALRRAHARAGPDHPEPGGRGVAVCVSQTRA